MAKPLKVKAGGYDAAKERQERARKAFRISLPESEFSFVYRPFGNSVRVRGWVRDQTGLALDELLVQRGAVDTGTLADMWWISRMGDGETGANGRPVSRGVVQDEFDEACPGAMYGDFDQVDITDEVDDSPKA